VSPLPVDLGGGLLVRRYTMADLDAIWKAVRENRERLGVWMPWVEHTRTIDDQRAWLTRVVADEANLDGTGLWVDGEYAGGIGVQVWPFAIGAEIGYWIRSRFEGRGFVTRAAEAMVRLAFEEIGVHRVTVRAGVDNKRSRAIPERLGFTYEGIERGGGKGAGGFYDLAVYGLLEDEWRAAR
jgi:ribosomal-protein-serine acetyltransferase